MALRYMRVRKRSGLLSLENQVRSTHKKALTNFLDTTGRDALHRHQKKTTPNPHRPLMNTSHNLH